MDLLRPRAKKGGGARRKEAARGGKKRVTRGEESYRGKLLRRGEYGHDKESKILGISKLPSHCAYAKMPSLVHQMSSLPKCISQIQNCWRAIKVFGKFQECKVQLHNCWRCSKVPYSFKIQISALQFFNPFKFIMFISKQQYRGICFYGSEAGYTS